MALNQVCLNGCAPAQIMNLNIAINDISSVSILDDCNNVYPKENVEYAYSVDGVCWSCYMSYDEMLANTIGLDSDFYVREKVNGPIGGVELDEEPTNDYNTSIASGFEFSYCTTSGNTNVYNPYINLDGAVSLAQQLTENVSCVVGIPCYYFKLSPNVGSKDITFKEYALMDVESVKQIKIVIVDNQMPSSKPEFNDWGLDWQTDWETEISKGTFATAFGPTAQPQEGDLVYIPMMKRMWMVNEAYEEKRDAFMWNATTFHVTLVKYQEKDSVDLKDTESLVNTFVKNKYEDLFGDNENIDSGEEFTTTPNYNPDNLYPVFESDAMRKYISPESVDFKQGLLYFRGTMIADDIYSFNGINKGKIIYQRPYCGTDITISFIINCSDSIYSGTLIQIGHLKLNIEQFGKSFNLKFVNNPKTNIKLDYNKTYFVYLRYSQSLNVIELSASEYVHADLPLYKLQNHHYWFDIDNSVKSISKYSLECVVDSKSEVILNSFYGTITNIKVFESYIDNVSEILQMYPTNKNLIINDTARKIVDLNGIKI